MNALHRSLVVRLLALSVLISVCSIAATAWLAVRTTARAIRQEQGQAISDDSRIYEALVARAATHADWQGVQALVDRLAGETGHRVVLTTQDRRPIADSDSGRRAPLPDRASATVDALSVDAGISGSRGSDRIDSRAVGPFRLTPAERTELTALAQRRVNCFDRIPGIRATIATAPNGRPRVDAPGYTGSRCANDALDRPTRTEARALAQLDTLVGTCLSRRGSGPVRLAPDLTWTGTGSRTPVDDQLVPSCLDSARREQLASYVAPAALLFIGSPDQAAAVSPFDLSAPNRLRMAAVVGSVLLLTVAVTVGLGLRLVRPLRALTTAAHRMKAGDLAARVQVTGKDEIGRLAEVFNQMSRHRAELERLRTEMVGDIAHELRTPLSNIRGWLEAADDGVVPADRALVGSLLEEALLLQHVVDDLRDLAAADAGALRLHKVPCDVAELLQQVVTAHRGRADHAGVGLCAEDGVGLGTVDADPVRLRQAVANLVSNAVRHTPSGGTVTIRAHRDDDTVVIAVADTGGGIRPEDLPRVFDRFWRAEKSRNRGTGGSGLGLAIVRNLAHAHGGSVTAESTYGEGSLFTLRLPAGGGRRR